MDKLEGVRFAVDETPYCLWDWDISELNLDFINSIDPGYFEHLARIHGQLLETEERQYAAVVLRTTYAHSLETLFALLSAAIQAPDCVVGWLLRYKKDDLKSIINKINNRRPLLSKLSIKPMSWESIAEAIHPISTGDTEKDSRIIIKFANLWRRLSKNFSDENLIREYESVKHGLRVSMGGFTWRLGLQDQLGVPAPLERMITMGTSEFGAAFHYAEQLGRYNFRIKRQSLNWSPQNIMHGLNLVSMSISNIITFLKFVNGIDRTDLMFTCPTDEAYFDEPWKTEVHTSSMSMNSIIDPSWIKPLSREEILSVYDQDANKST